MGYALISHPDSLARHGPERHFELRSGCLQPMENRRVVHLDEEAWIEAALDLLVSGTADSVGIEPLAKQLGVTKGSFYWHFRDRAALLSGMLRQWQQRATTGIIARLENTVASPAEKLRLL